MEIYTKIKGFENYAISNHGNVLNIKTQKFLKPCTDGGGYYIVCLGRNNGKHLHRLIAEHFIDNPNNYTVVDHIDRDKTNNGVSNLRWTTRIINGRNSKKTKNTTSQYRGVHYDKSRNKWGTKITNYYKTINIGRFNTELEAAEAYNKYVIGNELQGFVLNEL